MRTILSMSLFSCLLATGAQAAEITRLDAHTIRFYGGIASGDAARLEQAYTPGTTRLQVQSGGGDSEEAMKMGRFIHDKGLDIEITRVCASSCANYMFPAAAHKTILPGAVLGYHGTLYLTEQAGEKDMKADMSASGMSPQDMAKALPDMLANVRRLAKLESEFAAYIGIRPQFYREFRTVAEKGETLDQQYAARKGIFLWWPSAQRLATCYGIRDVNDQARPAELESTGYSFEAKRSFLLVGDQSLQACAS